MQISRRMAVRWMATAGLAPIAACSRSPLERSSGIPAELGEVRRRTGSLPSLVTPKEINAATSLVDHAHLILALGDTRLSSAGISNGGSQTHVNWLLGPAAGGSGPGPSWLVQNDDGWVPKLNPILNAGGPGEAHPGQFFCYLLDRGCLNRNTTVSLPDGSATPISRIVDAMASGVRLDGDNDHLVPSLLLLSSTSEWRRPFGDSVGLRQLMSSEIDAGGDSRPCFGSHWLKALALAAGPIGATRLGDSISDHAAVTLRTWTRRLSDSFLSSGEVASMTAAPLPLQRPDYWTLAGHYIAAAADLLPIEELLEHTCYWRAVLRLAEASNEVQAMPLRVRAHAHDALRRAVTAAQHDQGGRA